MAQSRTLQQVVSDLITLDFDAIDAYEVAIARLKRDEVARRELVGFKGDHERHVRELSTVLTTLGGTPPRGGDAKRVLTAGRVVLASLVGDANILKAMRTNEDTTNDQYEQALSEPGVSGELRELLARNLADERRHRSWLEQRIISLRDAA